MYVLLWIRNEVVWEEINSPYFKLPSSSAGGEMVGSLRDRTWQIEEAPEMSRLSFSHAPGGGSKKTLSDGSFALCLHLLPS